MLPIIFSYYSAYSKNPISFLPAYATTDVLDLAPESERRYDISPLQDRS